LSSVIAPHAGSGEPVVAALVSTAKLPVPEIAADVDAALQSSVPCALAEDASPVAAKENASPRKTRLANVREAVECERHTGLDSMVGMRLPEKRKSAVDPVHGSERA
jgi:hypothetical protein